jgi:hypothetical protein
MKTLQTQTQTNDDALQLNARLFKKSTLFGEKQLVLVIERRFFLCEKNFEFFQKLIATSLLDAETQLIAKAKIDFNDKTKALLTLKEFGVEIEKN